MHPGMVVSVHQELRGLQLGRRMSGQRLASQRLGFLLPAGLLVAGALALVYWLVGTAPEELRSQLSRLQFIWLEVSFVGCLFAAVVALPRLVASLALQRRHLLALAGCSALALLLVGPVAPRTSRIFFDEQIYTNIAQNLSDLHAAQVCNEGHVEYGILDCQRGEYNKQPYAWPYLIAWTFRLFGTHEGLAFLLNNLAFMALPWVLAATAILLFRGTRAGVLAGLVSVLIPEQAQWSDTASAEPTAELFVALALLASIWWARDRTWTAAAFAATTLALACQFRTESPLVLVVAATTLAVLAPRELISRRALWAAVAGLASLAVAVAHAWMVRGESWGASGPRNSWSFVVPNLATNARYFFDNREFPVLISVLALAGVALARRREIVPALAVFAAFWGVFLPFYAGSYQFGADDRYALMAFPGVALLAGAGGAALADLAERKSLRLALRPSLLIAAAVALNFSLYLPAVRAEGEEAWQARRDVDFARAATKELPPNSIVLTHDPSMFLVWGQAAAQMYLAEDAGWVRDYLVPRYQGGVFLHWNYWCNTVNDPNADLCRQVRSAYFWEPFREYRERDLTVALLALQPRGLAPMSSGTEEPDTRHRRRRP